jgi:hypothetical protein
MGFHALRFKLIPVDIQWNEVCVKKAHNGIIFVQFTHCWDSQRPFE